VTSELNRYAKICCDGSYVICPWDEAANYLDDDYDLILIEVFMTREQFENLPEFNGF
jgi:hypothetical protein